MAPLKNVDDSARAKTTIWLRLILATIIFNGIGIHKLNAQTTNNTAVIIKGSVADENGMPVPGARITNVANKATGITNMDGNFEIAALVGDDVEVNFNDVVIQNSKVINLNKLDIVLTNAQIDKQKTLAAYPVTTTTGGSKPIKFSMPDPNFFSSLFQYVGQKVK